MARDILGYRDSTLHDLMRPFIVKGPTKRLVVQVLKRMIKDESSFDKKFAQLLVENFKQNAVYKPFCATFKKWVPSFVKECKDAEFASFLNEIYADAKEIRNQYTTELGIKSVKERAKIRKSNSKAVKGDLTELLTYLTERSEIA